MSDSRVARRRWRCLSQVARDLAVPHRPYVLCSRVMSSGGGRVDLRFDLREPVVVVAACGFGEGCADRRLLLREGVSTALSGGCPFAALNVDSELERGGAVPSGDGLIVDENGTYIADGGSPVGVDVRSDRSEPDPDPELEVP